MHTQLTKTEDRGNSVFFYLFAEPGSWPSPGTQATPAAGVTTPSACWGRTAPPDSSGGSGLVTAKCCLMFPPASDCPHCSPVLVPPVCSLSGQFCVPQLSGEAPALPPLNTLPSLQLPLLTLSLECTTDYLLRLLCSQTGAPKPVQGGQWEPRASE